MSFRQWCRTHFYQTLIIYIPKINFHRYINIVSDFHSLFRLLNFDDFEKTLETEKGKAALVEAPSVEEVESSGGSSYLPSQLLLSEGQSLFAASLGTAPIHFH